LAEGRSTTWRIGGRFGEGEGTEKTDGRVEKRKDVSPSNVGSGIGVGARIEEDTGTEFDDIIRRDSKAVPKKPPATGRIWKRSVIRVAAEEVAIVTPIRSEVGRGIEGLREIHLHEIPTRSKSASRAVGDEEQAVGRKSNSSMESSASGMNGRDRRVVGNTDGDGSGSRDGSSRKGKRQSRGDRGIGIRYVMELEQRRMISRKRGGEPHVVVHLNVERGTKWMRKW
jgi:hypothetical protein